MIVFYHLFRYLFLGGVRIAALKNAKAKLWLEGRKNWHRYLEKEWKVTSSDKVIWMHCASAGEFEQGRPLLESIRTSYPNARLIVSFFSPSGYEMQKTYEGVDQVIYLPFDSKRNAAKFIKIVKPSLVIFVKYEFWYFYLTTLKKMNIPTLMVSGIFRADQPFFKWWGSFHRKMLDCFTFFFLQDAASVQLLESIGYKSNSIISGDTRFDRVAEIAAVATDLPIIDSFCSDKILIAGSTWPEDEALLQEWYQLQMEWRLIIVPHEISKTHIESLQNRFPSALLFTELSGNENIKSSDVLIIDTMGMLSKIYRYGTLCYIGGGLTKGGHHNILEAAVYGKAAVTGPHIKKFSESVALNKSGGSFIVKDGKDLWQICNNAKSIEEAGRKAGAFVSQHLGSTKKIMDWIQANLLLTSE